MGHALSTCLLRCILGDDPVTAAARLRAANVSFSGLAHLEQVRGATRLARQAVVDADAELQCLLAENEEDRAYDAYERLLAQIEASEQVKPDASLLMPKELRDSPARRSAVPGSRELFAHAPTSSEIQHERIAAYFAALQQRLESPVPSSPLVDPTTVPPPSGGSQVGADRLVTTWPRVIRYTLRLPEHPTGRSEPRRAENPRQKAKNTRDNRIESDGQTQA